MHYHSLNCRPDVIPIAGTGGSQTKNPLQRHLQFS